MILILPSDRRIHFFCHHDYYVNSKTGLRISHWSFIYRRIYCIDYFSLPLDRENQENPLDALEWSYEKPYDFFRNTDQFCCICLLNRSVNVGLICLHKYLEMQVFPKIAHHKSFGMIYQPLTMTKLEWCTIVRKTIIRQGQVTVPACNMFSNWNFLSSALKLILNASSFVVSHNFWPLKRQPPQLQDHLYI